jgi:hypothetical protein
MRKKGANLKIQICRHLYHFLLPAIFFTTVAIIHAPHLQVVKNRYKQISSLNSTPSSTRKKIGTHRNL